MVVERPTTVPKRNYPASTVFQIAAFFKRIFNNLTVEPAMFLLAFSQSMDQISVDQVLFYRTAKYKLHHFLIRRWIPNMGQAQLWFKHLRKLLKLQGLTKE